MSARLSSAQGTLLGRYSCSSRTGQGYLHTDVLSGTPHTNGAFTRDAGRAGHSTGSESTSRRHLLQGELSSGGGIQLYNLIGEDSAMKRLLLVFSLMCVLGFAGQASAALQKKINIFNGAQVEIDTLYISPTNANDWEENVLKQETLPNGDKADIEISRTENAEAWDIKVTNKKGESMTWIGVPLNKSGQITLLPNGQYNAK